MSDEWFRSARWDADVQDEFERRLGRARSGRPQYLKVQGFTLLESGDPALVEPGRALLERLLEEHPDDLMQTTEALFHLGRSHAATGELGVAERYLRAAKDAERGKNFHTGAGLSLAEVLVASGGSAALQEADELLSVEAAREMLLPIDAWRVEVARARLAAALGQRDAAATYASAALHWLTEPAPLPRHPTVGLVPYDRAVVAEMQRLAGVRPGLFARLTARARRSAT